MHTVVESAINISLPILLMLVLSACGGSNRSAEDRVQSCLQGGGKREVLDIMQDWYLWNDEAEQINKYRDINLRQFEDADALLAFLRFRPAQFDRGFSYITTPAEEAAFFGEGQFVGFGISLVRVAGNEVRFSQVFTGSPAAAAGFERGFRLLAINGRSIAEIDAAEGLTAALGPATAGFTAMLTVENAAGTALPPVNVSKSVVTIDPVPVVRVLEDPSGDPVAGYILFRTFISSASTKLRDAFAQLGAQGVQNIVIDLRYNGGGLVSVSDVLASLLAGLGNVGNVYSMFSFNSARAPGNNFSSFFDAEANALNLNKVIFITAGASASASELVINGLQPYFRDPGEDLALIGATTYGKPVGQYAFDFCNDRRRLRLVTFKTVNVEGFGDYFSGLPADCPAGDDLLTPLGDESEVSVAAAIEYLQTGSCPVSVTGFTASRAGTAAVKSQLIWGPGLAQQYAGAF